MENVNPACILPMCEREDDQRIGTWKTLTAFEDQIVFQVGFAKAPHQAPCLKIDIGGVPHRFVHVKKQAAWFVAAVGGPQLKKGDMPAVTLLEELADKLILHSSNKDVDDEPETAVAAMGEVDSKYKLFDPMSELNGLYRLATTGNTKEEATTQNKYAEVFNAACCAHAKTTALRSM